MVLFLWLIMRPTMLQSNSWSNKCHFHLYTCESSLSFRRLFFDSSILWLFNRLTKISFSIFSYKIWKSKIIWILYIIILTIVYGAFFNKPLSGNCYDHPKSVVIKIIKTTLNFMETFYFYYIYVLANDMYWKNVQGPFHRK